MRKVLSALVAVVLVFSVAFQTQVSAAPSIGIYIDGVKLYADQAPIATKGRVMLPMRAIFEALHASVDWNVKNRTVTGVKYGTTVILKIGSKQATINGRSVALDVPAQMVKGRTMVPVRFVSEALGAGVVWQSNNVYITTSNSNPNPNPNPNPDPNPYPNPGQGNVSAVSNVSARIIGQKGDGRDVEISFSKSSTETYVDHYRIMLVKAEDARNFNSTKARTVSSSNYTVTVGNGRDQVISLSSQTRDVDGALIKANQPYVAYVLTVGTGTNQYVLSSSSSSVTLSTPQVVSPATNVRVNDVSDYGDGRDLSVTFNKADNDSNIANYRIMVVKTQDANKFDLAAANAVSNSYSTLVYKNGSSMTTTLSSAARDTSGDLIKNGVPYTVFVLSVSNSNNYANNLSSSSSSITLSSIIGAPVITKVDDVSNYGDGRDLQVSFNKSPYEGQVSYYRIFVVRLRDASSFNLTEANKVSSGRYYDIAKNGYNIVTTLPSNMKDVQGSYIMNGEDYRVFVMAVSNDRNDNNNLLSSASNIITLSNNNSLNNVATNVTVSNVNNYNDGRDLRVSFNKAADESNISQYRIMIVRTGDASRFNLSTANNVSSYNYTAVNKTGGYINTTLPSNARDVDGNLIRNGISYQAFVMSVGYYSSSNALSAPSTAITLGNNNNVNAATNVTVNDVGDNNDGRDMRVAFNRASDESNIGHYRVMVVKAENAYRFNLATANNVSSYNYTLVNKNGGNISRVLDSGARDVDGAYIRNGVSYQVFVLSVGTGYYSGDNALSAPSSTITLSSNNIGAVTNVLGSDVSDYGDGRDLLVTFNSIGDEWNLSQYRVMVVKSANASRFNLTVANNVPSAYYTPVGKNGRAVNLTLPANARDIDGDLIRDGISYQIFVLSVGNYSGSNALSAPSPVITLSNNTGVGAATNVAAKVVGNYGTGRDVEVSFMRSSNEANVGEYRIMVVKSNQANAFNLAEANNVPAWGYTRVAKQGWDIRQYLSDETRDINGDVIAKGVNYRVFVLTAGDPRLGSVNALSAPSGEFMIANLSVQAATNVLAVRESDGTSMKVYFDRAANESNIAYYAVMAVPYGYADSFTLNDANRVSSNAYKVISTGAGQNTVTLTSYDLDSTGASIRNGIAYKVFILSIADGRNATVNSLSAPSDYVLL